MGTRESNRATHSQQPWGGCVSSNPSVLPILFCRLQWSRMHVQFILDAHFSIRTGHAKDGVRELVCSLTILQAHHIWFPFADCLIILSAQPETVWHCRYFSAHLSARQIIIYSVAKLVFCSFFYTL